MLKGKPNLRFRGLYGHSRQCASGQVLGQKDSFAHVFYLVFFEKYPEVRQHFTQVNFKHQNALLSMALLVMEQHYRFNYPATEMYLNYLGTKHDVLGISPNLYPSFRDALLMSFQRFHGSAWDNHLADQWREAIDKTIEAMIKGYQEHYHA